MERITIERMEGDFFQMYREPFKDDSLSLKARGLLATIMALPPSWDFSIKGICSILKEGKSAIYTAINELVDYGYCSREETRNKETGKIEGVEYKFAEYAKFNIVSVSNPQTDFRDTENPDTENRTQYNKERIKDIKNNIDERYENFRSECMSYVGEFGERMIGKFISYWSEPNKSRSKMKWELQQTWDTHRRLLNWASKDYNRVDIVTPAKREEKPLSIEELMKSYGN